MPPNLHILTKAEMLSKFDDEGWEAKLSALCTPYINARQYKTVRWWHDSHTTFGFVIDHHYPSNRRRDVCFLRDGDEIYYYDESYLGLLQQP